MKSRANAGQACGVPAGVHPFERRRLFDMNVVDLIKATLACGGIAFLIYTYPVISQALLIGLLAMLWLSYAHRTIVRRIRR